MADLAVSEEDDLAQFRSLDREELIQIIVDDAKNWLAHDGLWFQAVEKAHGMEAAVAADREAWARFTVIEARRIMQRLGVQPGGGIPALLGCLRHRLYARLNAQRVTVATEDRAVLTMQTCRVQLARQAKGMAPFPCKSVGLVEYAEFARTIDPRISTRCIACPPDEQRDGVWCAWEFTLAREESR
jgi:hypothetical protein